MIMAAKNKNSIPVKKADDRVLVIIPKPRNVVGDTECTVGINGKMYQIQYGKPVYVPKNVAEVIQSHLDIQSELTEDIEDAIKVSSIAEL